MEERRQGMREMRDMVIRMDENLKAVKIWTEKHDCNHKTIWQSIDNLREWKWKWAGISGVVGLVVGVGLKVWLH